MINMVFLFIMFGKLIDIHISSEQETKEIERIIHDQERETNNTIRQNSNASDERRMEAWDNLIRNGDAL